MAAILLLAVCASRESASVEPLRATSSHFRSGEYNGDIGAVQARRRAGGLEDLGDDGRMVVRPGAIPSDAEFEGNRVRDWWI
jgi:hypothetical protein